MRLLYDKAEQSPAPAAEEGSLFYGASSSVLCVTVSYTFPLI